MMFRGKSTSDFGDEAVVFVIDGGGGDEDFTSGPVVEESDITVDAVGPEDFTARDIHGVEGMLSGLAVGVGRLIAEEEEGVAVGV